MEMDGLDGGWRRTDRLDLKDALLFVTHCESCEGGIWVGVDGIGSNRVNFMGGTR